MQSDLLHLVPLIESKSNLKDLSLFHKSVNIVFHDIEAKYYDQLHAEMWDSLQPVYDSFVNDLPLSELKNLKILDIGCGTGLSTQMLINTPLKNNIKEATLLDTSSVMLQKAKARFKELKIKFNFFEGDLKELNDKDFDLILISSVLHHIPDLADFFKELNKKLKVGGIFFHIHDPNGDAIKTQVYLERVSDLREFYAKKNRKIWLRILNRLKRTLSKKKEPDYMLEVNESLIQQNIIHTHLTEQEIWSITDIHVEDLPYSTKNGISIKLLQSMLPNFKLLNTLTYSFFGVLESNLPKSFLEKERNYFKNGDLHGRNIGALWIKNR